MWEPLPLLLPRATQPRVDGGYAAAAAAGAGAAPGRDCGGGAHGELFAAPPPGAEAAAAAWAGAPRARPAAEAGATLRWPRGQRGRRLTRTARNLPATMIRPEPSQTFAIGFGIAATREGA